MIDTGKLLEENSIVKIIGNFVALTPHGQEHIGICPFHKDTTASLRVNDKKGIYKCFACSAGGDAISFIQKHRNVSFLEAVKLIADGMDDLYSIDTRPVKLVKESEWKQVIPPPNSLISVFHPKYGETSLIWAYHDECGQIAGYSCRFDLGDGNKDVLPYSYVTNGTETKWRFVGFDKPRRLYNLHLIHKYPNATVIVVEGEKTADAVQAQLDVEKSVVSTWPGGANGLVAANFEVLKGRNVILWPDHDTEQKYNDSHEKAGQVKPWYEQPGNHAMLKIHDILNGHCPKLKWVDVPESYPNKWDGADKDWQPKECREFILEHLIDVPAVEIEPVVEVVQVESEPISEPIPEPTSKPPATPIINPPVPVHSSNTRIDNPHFKLLGYDKDENSTTVFYFFSFAAKTVIKMKPSSMSKSNLMQLAPINWWEDQFGGGNAKVNIDACQQFLIDYSYKVGLFKEKSIRGRGAWVDENRFVIHTGESLIVNMKSYPLRGIESRYVYEIGEHLGFGGDKPMSNADANSLLKNIEWFAWERDINAYFLAGWCVVAPFCGILKWRPHIWVTGAAGSGKSWVMEHVIKRLLGESAIVVQGKTTEAGVRGLVQNDARPVVFDESDTDNDGDKERVQNVVSLARSASYHDSGVIGKGTQSGGSHVYTMRSMFVFSSIGIQLNQQSDRSRFTILGLMNPRDHGRTDEEFHEFETKWHSIITDEFVQSMQARTIRMLPTILKNTKTFADAVSAVIGQKRIGDQVGAMLAGAYSLSSTKEISYENAIKWVKDRDWSDEKGLELTKDETQLFAKIMSAKLRVETDRGVVERTVGELVLISADLMFEPILSSHVAYNRLRRAGIMLSTDKRFIHFANNSDGLRELIRNSPWVSNYNKTLERLPQAMKVDTRTYYPGCKSRGVSLPITMVSDGFEQTELPKAGIMPNPYEPARVDDVEAERDDEFPF